MIEGTTPKSRPALNLLPTPIYWLLLWVTFFAITLLLYIKALHATPLFDDVAIPVYFNPVRQFGWLNCLVPLENGFIRPLTMASFKLVWTLGGTTAALYHLLSAVIHAAVAATSAVAFCVITGASRSAALAVGLTVAMASAAFPTVYMLSNSCDSFMALGMLLAMTAWWRWLETATWQWLTATLLGLAIAFAGKETAVAIGGIFVLQTWIAQPLQRKRAWIYTAGLFTVCAAYALLILLLQHRNESSYANAGWTSYSPAHVTTRLLGMLTATLFPGTFVMAPLWNPFGLATAAGSFFHVAAGLLLLVAGGSLLLPKIAPHAKKSAMFYLAAAGMLLPTSILTLPFIPSSPSGRFLYSAIPLVIMAVGCLVVHWWPRRKAVRRGIFAVWLLWLVLQVTVVRKSPGTREYYDTSREWKNFIAEIDRLRKDWPPMQGVTVYSGAPHGSRHIPGPYGMAIFQVYFPDMLAAYFSNHTLPETTRTYSFDGKNLETYSPET